MLDLLETAVAEYATDLARRIGRAVLRGERGPTDLPHDLRVRRVVFRSPRARLEVRREVRARLDT